MLMTFVRHFVTKHFWLAWTLGAVLTQSKVFIIFRLTHPRATALEVSMRKGCAIAQQSSLDSCVPLLCPNLLYPWTLLIPVSGKRDVLTTFDMTNPTIVCEISHCVTLFSAC